MRDGNAIVVINDNRQRHVLETCQLLHMISNGSLTEVPRSEQLDAYLWLCMKEADWGVGKHNPIYDSIVRLLAKEAIREFADAGLDKE